MKKLIALVLIAALGLSSCKALKEMERQRLIKSDKSKGNH